MSQGFKIEQRQYEGKLINPNKPKFNNLPTKENFPSYYSIKFYSSFLWSWDHFIVLKLNR